MSFLATALCLAIGSREPIGRISEPEFLSHLSNLGFDIGSIPQKQPINSVKKLKSGSTEFLMTWTMYMVEESRAVYVGNCRGHAEFDLPRPMSKDGFTAWLKSQGLQQLTGSSLLGGRVSITYHLFDEATSLESLKERTSLFLSGVRKVKNLAAQKGGKQALDIAGIGSAKLDPSFKLDWVEQGDIEFLRQAMGWKEGAMPGGGKGWLVPIQFGKVPIFVNGMFGKSAVLLICTGRPDKEKAQKLERAHVAIDWADATVTSDLVHISTRLNQDNGIKAKDLTGAIQTFARQVNELDLF